MSMKQLILFTTSHCHLCEQAETMLTNLQQQYQIQWQLIEISDDVTLSEKYGIRIPVIKHADNQIELNWPFSEKDIVRFITT